MIDPRVTELAELLCTHSTDLQNGETVLIHAFDVPDEVVAEVVRVAQSKGADALVRIESALVRRQLLHGLTESSVKTMAKAEMAEMKLMDAYISLRGSDNISESSDVPDANLKLFAKEYTQPVVLGERVPNTKWVGLRWPSSSMAQQASMSTPAFEDFFFRVCTMDYKRMATACEPLAELMSSTDRVRLVGPGTDLSFSIKGIGAVPCTGGRNIPDGECFSCPIKDSVEGEVTYNTANLYQGAQFKNIHFKVKSGKIYEAEAGDKTEKLNDILDTDDGARYFGEWSLGFNPYVLHPMLDTLFDEKIAGSFHLTPGNAYEGPGGNSNKSAIHWDIVCIQRPEYGGGEVWFDDRLIRKDGEFVLDSLTGLNAAQLGA